MTPPLLKAGPGRLMPRVSRLSDQEATLLEAVRVGRWWRQCADQAAVRRDATRQTPLADAAEQCLTAAAYWINQCIYGRRTWRVPVLGVRLTKAQHTMIRDCTQRRVDGHCAWDRLRAAYPPVT